MPKIVSIDTETTGLDTFDPQVQVTHASYWTSLGKGAAFEIGNHEKKERLSAYAADPTVTKLMFNAKFDLRMLDKIGIKVRGPLIDVMLIAQLLLPDEKVKNLKHLVRKFLKDPYIEETRLKQWLRANKTKIYGHAPKHIIEPYALADARRTLELFFFLSGGLDKQNLWTVLEREMLLMRKVVLPMETAGVHIDMKGIDPLKIKVREELKPMKTRMCEIAQNPAFNPNSGKQALAALAVEGIFRPTRFSNQTGKPKVDVAALLEFPSELGSLLVKYRKLSKANSTYLKNFDSPLLHVSFNQGGARTGRFSSSGPNLQNIPRADENTLLGQMRRLFVAPRGYRLLCIDYKQIELRLTAHFSQQQHMLDAILSDEDLHGVTCKKMFGIDETHAQWKAKRYFAKTLNFAVLYGIGPDKYRLSVLKDTAGTTRISLVQASSYINDWKLQHPAVMKLFENVALEVAKTGGIENHYGRYMPVESGKSYVGVNYKVQGSAADFLKMKMFAVAKLLRNHETKLIMQVHDELVFRVPVAERSIVCDLLEVMEDKTTFDVPLLCSAKWGPNWFDQQDIELPR